MNELSIYIPHSTKREINARTPSSILVPCTAANQECPAAAAAAAILLLPFVAAAAIYCRRAKTPLLVEYSEQ